MATKVSAEEAQAVFGTASQPAAVRVTAEEWQAAAPRGAQHVTSGSAGVSMPTPPGAEDTSRNRARALLSGLALDFGDEAAGVVGAIANVFGEGSERLAAMGTGEPVGDPTPPLETYRDIRGAEHEALEAYRQAQPLPAAGMALGGGMMTGGAAGARFAASPAGQAVSGLPPWLRAGVAGALGGGIGAATGAGRAATLADVPREAAIGAAVGAPLGAAGELVATGAGRVAHALSPQRAAERRVTRALDRAGITPTEAGQVVTAMGPRMTVADVSDATAEVLESAANQPGATRTAARRQLTARSQRQGQDILEPFGEGRVIQMGRELAQDRAERAGPLYEEAFARGVQQTPELDAVLASDAVETAWRRAKKAGRDEAVAQGVELDPRMLGSDASPSLQGWQAVTMQLNDMIASAQRGANPSPSAARRLTAIRNRINAELDRQNPAYAQARALWAGNKQFEEAMQEGRKFLTQSSDVTADTLQQMGEADRAAYRIGVAQALQDRIERMGDTHDVTKLFRTSGMRAKLEALFPDEQQRADILQRIGAASVQQQTMGQVLGNSATARRLAAAADESMIPEVAGMAAEMATTGAPASAVAGGQLRSMARRIPTSREATRNRMGAMLLESDPLEVNRMMQLLEAGGTPYQRGASGLPVVVGAGVVPALATDR